MQQIQSALKPETGYLLVAALYTDEGSHAANSCISSKSGHAVFTTARRPITDQSCCQLQFAQHELDCIIYQLVLWRKQSNHVNIDRLIADDKLSEGVFRQVEVKSLPEILVVANWFGSHVSSGW